MQIFLSNGKTRLSTGLMVLFLSACVSGPPAPVIEIPLEATKAQREQATGNFSGAAKLWQQAAMVAVGPERHQYRLQAAEAWLQAGDNAQSASLLKQVDIQKLQTDRVSRYSLLHAELALAVADGEAAQTYLASARPNLTANQQPRYQRLMARAARLQTDPASFALSTAAYALRSSGPYNSTRGVAILQLLEDVSSSVLRRVSADVVNAYGLNDWPELTVLIRETLITQKSVSSAATKWADEHPGHEVAELEFAELAGRYRAMFSLPGNIAVLLPNAGSLAAAGKAIRDGLVSAFLSKPEGVTLRFYPTTEDPQSAVSAYFQAVREGAQWIIGPLRRESVEAISELGSLGVPALVLNNTPKQNSPRSNDDLLFRLSLSPEHEASAIARQALKNGHSRAIMLTPDSVWGSRMEAAFGQAFTNGGGRISTSSKFDPAENDHSALLTALLEVDNSNERRNRVQATLSIALNFEPSRRDDFDLFFLAANPIQGRQLRPQFRFHDAGDKPVYAMSRIFGGQIDATKDQDLNGIYFPSTDFLLSHSATGTYPDLASLRGGSFSSLHALGRDAWNLLPWLFLMHKDTDLQFPGSIGSLHMDRNGQLIRDPVWAQFSRGRPRPVEWPADNN